MDLSKYSLERCEADSEWDDLVERSAQGTLFSTSAFLDALPFPVSIWLCRKNSQIVGGLALIEAEAPRATRIAPHVIHGGPLFSPAPAEQVRAMTLSEEYRITSALLALSLEHYDTLIFQGAPTLNDLRPFQWHNYGAPGPHAEITIRYTSYLDISPRPDGSWDDWPVYRAFNKSRRQSVRYADADGITTQRDNTGFDTFLAIYDQTFERQGMIVDAEERALLQSVCRGLQAAGRLRLFVSSLANGTIGSVSIWGLDAKRAYYLYGANAPELRDSHCGTMAIVGAFEYLAEEGVTEVDMEGINSPQRGYFKLSFGGDIRPYPRVQIKP